MPNPTGLLCDDTYLRHLPGRTGHPECPERLMAVRDSLRKAPWFAALLPIAPRMATPQELGLAHEPDYLTLIGREAADVEGLKQLSTGDTIVSRDSLEVAQLAAGGVLAAADAVMDGKVSNLPRQLSDVRAKGYAFEKALESQVQGLTEQWGRIKQTVSDDVKQQSASLNQVMQGIQAQMAQVMAQSANPNAARPAFMQVKSMAASAEAQAAAAEGAIYGQYDDFQASVESLSAHLDWVGWMLEALASASFTLLATEGGVAAAEVNWLRPNSDPMGGVLFLTDQRIIFEEREGEFSVPLEAPLAQVQSADAESGQGAGGDEEHLKIIFAPGAPASYGLFHLVGPKAEDWKTQIGRATKGDYTSDRAVAIDQAAVDKVKSAPTQCPNCSAAFTKPVLRGQTEITCEFCGAVTRL